ncbi:hypothetical protein TNCV_3352441 [Trichonephila clavipes]|nr:hypothetical protein TNCV_3352441 [Trichonephila clavipes]
MSTNTDYNLQSYRFKSRQEGQSLYSMKPDAFILLQTSLGHLRLMNCSIVLSKCVQSFPLNNQVVYYRCYNTELNSVAQQPMKPRPPLPISVYVTLNTGGMCRYFGQVVSLTRNLQCSVRKQAWCSFITEGMKG